MEHALHEEYLAPGLRYTEKLRDEPGQRPACACELWIDGQDADVSRCSILEFQQRIGSVAIASAGYAGLSTSPQHRRGGYASRLLRRSIERLRERVDIAYLYASPRDLYHKFGFAGCYADCEMRLTVRDGELLQRPAGVRLRPMTPADYGTVCGLHNREHAERSWSHVREPGRWRGPSQATDWSTGQDGMVALEDGVITGAALYDGVRYGVVDSRFAVELCATSAPAADALIAEAVARGLAERREIITFLEPPDSTAGRSLRRLGCESIVRVTPRGEGMGCILNRQSLVEKLAPELARRAGSGNAAALKALAEGRLIPDNGSLLQLLIGFRSWRDLADTGQALPGEFAAVGRAWFPGWSESLPVACTHFSDRY